MNFSHLKKKCAGCGQLDPDTDREHVYPQWLIRRTNTKRSSFGWFDSDGDQIRISPLSITLPLCRTCNNDFANDLETPVSRLVDEIEAGQGINDYEAELLIRWIWKTTGLIWIALTPQGSYTEIYTLKQRCTQAIDQVRGSLVLGIALIESLDTESTDWPVGFYKAEKDALFGSGVFSRIALIVTRDEFAHLLPPSFTQYKLSPHRLRAENDAKVIFPKPGFTDDVTAVNWTRAYTQHLIACHDWYGAIQSVIVREGLENYLRRQTKHNKCLILTFFVYADRPPRLETWTVLDHTSGTTSPKIQEYFADLKMHVPMKGDARDIKPLNPDGNIVLVIRTDIDLLTLETLSHWLSSPIQPLSTSQETAKSWYDILTNLKP